MNIKDVMYISVYRHVMDAEGEWYYIYINGKKEENKEPSLKSLWRSGWDGCIDIIKKHLDIERIYNTLSVISDIDGTMYLIQRNCILESVDHIHKSIISGVSIMKSISMLFIDGSILEVDPTEKSVMSYMCGVPTETFVGNVVYNKEQTEYEVTRTNMKHIKSISVTDGNMCMEYHSNDDLDEFIEGHYRLLGDEVKCGDEEKTN